MSFFVLKNKRKVKLKILEFFSFIPDAIMLRVQYYIKTKRLLNLSNPKRFTEKLQWYKLHYRDPLMRTCADKYDVRKYIEEKGLADILVPIIGIYGNIEDVCFDQLPNRMVIKDTLGGGGNDVIICKDKESLNIKDTKKRMKEWLSSNTSYKVAGREWQYGGKKHRIIIEELLPSKEENGGLIDYKFFCFDGIPQIVYIVADRKVGQKAGLGIFTPDFQRLEVTRCDEKPLERNIDKPNQWEKMLEISKVLSKPFPEVRIDLYYVEEKIYFGEMTFFDGSGYMSFNPDSFDYILGSYFDIRKVKCNV